uniref:Adhesion G protein-coupled receptor E5 n=1 Tax=Equus asinus TaxID=9793 RepID=A0A9L0IUJ4_EQUAS
MGGARRGGLLVPHVLGVLLILSEAGGGQWASASAASAPPGCAPWCPRNSVCVNATACRCHPGFSSWSGEIITSPADSCDDINECGPPLAASCGKFADCQNVDGSYYCTCSPGYGLVSGATMFRNESENTCQDVDECSSRQHPCHNSTACINTVGSYRCRCRRGWTPLPGFRDNQNTTVCEEMSFPTWTLPPGIQSQDLIQSVDELLKAPGDLETLALPDRHHTVTHLLSGLEEVLRTLAKAVPGGSFTYQSPAGTELSLVIQEQGHGNVTLGQSHARMLLDWAVAAGAAGSGPAVAGILSNPNMQKLLANASLELDPERQAELEETHESPLYGVQLSLLSAVNSVFLSNTNTTKLDHKVTFAFSHSPEKPGTRQELICAFWKGADDGGGHWATSGCRTLGSRNNSTTCQCSHLSSFAVLMAHYDVEDELLALITTVGLALSLVCLLLCILTFLLVRPIQGSRTTLHLHLCICLFVGSAIFLAGIDNQGGEVGLRCRLVAGLLHYCFLAAFCWMALEGLELYFLVVRVFQGQGLRTRWLCLLGYGVPLLIVAISAAANKQGYGRPRYCWLDLRGGFLWSFLGPVIAIILGNAVIFVTTVWKLTRKFSEINPDVKKLKKLRVLTITAVAQLFVLGCTWVFGLFMFDPRSWMLSYVFSVLNCLQGLFLFVLHCLLNKKVREEYRKWACMVTGNKYSEFTTSTSVSSQSQTRALRSSESGI